jgi:hypothetical protein
MHFHSGAGTLPITGDLPFEAENNPLRDEESKGKTICDLLSMQFPGRR